MSMADIRGRSMGPSNTLFQSTGAKTIFYGNNGGGRDTYISNNNGGFCATNDPKKAGDIGSFVVQKKAPRSFHPVIHSKAIQYHSDGSGRDSYIKTSHGGLAVSYSPGASCKTFFNTLRSYDRIEMSPTMRDNSGSPVNRNSGMRGSAAGFYSVKFQKQMQEFKSYQDMQSRRLAQPKFPPKRASSEDERDSPVKLAGKSIAAKD